MKSITFPKSDKKISDDIFGYGYFIDMKVKIIAPQGSRAQKYAKKNKIPFEEM